MPAFEVFARASDDLACRTINANSCFLDKDSATAVFVDVENDVVGMILLQPGMTVVKKGH